MLTTTGGCRATGDHGPDTRRADRQGRVANALSDIFQTIDEVRNAVRAFVARYNAEWLIEKNGHRSPDAMRAAWHDQTFRRAA